jgi:hypothetical protein
MKKFRQFLLTVFLTEARAGFPSWITRAFLGLLVPASAMAGPWIWWEAENPSSSNIPATTWLSPANQTERNACSGGNILTAVNIKTAGPYWANYYVTVAQAGTYRLYTRKIWEYGAFKWRFDGGAWGFASYQLQLLDNGDYKQYFGLNWVYLGDVSLTAGQHLFRVELNVADWPNDPHYNAGVDLAGFDAFLLDADPFVPRGKLKPGDKYNLAEPGKWSFEPPIDDFSTAALLDLRSLNEPVAGQSGCVRTAADASGKFVLGDGTPVRFWGVNVGAEALDLASMTVQAKFLAKRGVNLVRFLGNLCASSPTNINAVDAFFVDNTRRAVAAFKQEGIYTELNFFWASAFTIRKEWGVDGYTDDKTGPTAILMFDDKLKAAYKQWVTQLFAPTNAYTGIPLAQDPAVAIIELQNEDSFFFWTFDPSSLPQAQRQKLETKFGAWLIAQYGSIAAAQAGWGGVSLTTDAPASGSMGLASAWYMTATDTDPWFLAFTPRMADQIHFLTDLQRAFYQEMGDFFRNILGCHNLITSCNWTTADELFLLDAERYTYTPNDVIDKHAYFDAIQVNPTNPGNENWSVNVGDYYQSHAVVTNPRLLPAAIKQITGYPQTCSESTWMNPNRFKAEGPLLIAAYNSMADIDGWIWFATSAMTYEESAGKFVLARPSLMGQFPGAALLYRRGDVEAPVAVRESRNLNRAYDKEPGLISEYNAGRNPPDSPVYNPATGTGRLDPLAFLVGRVECNYLTQDGSNYLAPGLLKHMDITNQVVESLSVPGAAHGQLKLDWSNGVFQVNSPRSQGVSGFLNHLPGIDLDDVTIASSNEFGAVLVISLDGLPIAQSQEILIQAMTEDNPYHWQEQDQVFTNNNVVYNGKKILSLGQPPMNVVNIAGSVTLRGLGQGHAFQAKVLDENGYVRGPGASQVFGPDLQVSLPTNSLYMVLLLPPTIASQSQSQAVMEGSNVLFSVSAGGTLPLSYQWQFNANPLPGETDPTLRLESVQAAQAGNYSVVVTNAAGVTNSAVVVLTVNVPATIATQPQSQTVTAGTTVTFSVTASGTSPLSYQWQFNGTNLADNGLITGSQSNWLTMANVLVGNAGAYQAYVTNACGSTTSAVATLTVLPATPALTWANPAAIPYGTALGTGQLNATASVPGNFAYSPTAGTVLNAGSTALSVVFTPDDSADFTAATGNVSIVVLPAPLSVTASNATRGYGAANPLLTGFISGLVNGDNVMANYSTPATSASPVGAYPIAPGLADPDHRLANYTVTVNNGTLAITPALLTVTAANATRVYGDTNPVFTGIITGLVGGDNVTATYSCTAAPTNLPGSYPIVPALVDPSNQQTNYQVNLVNGTLTVTPATPPTLIIVTPNTGPTNGGTTVILLGTGFENGAMVNFGGWPAASVAVISSTNLTAVTPPSGPTTVDVLVTNADGQSATLTNGFTYVAPLGTPPSIVSEPTNLVGCAGASVAFTVEAAGTAPWMYQWQFNGAHLTDDGRITGSQSNCLSVANVLVSDAGNYQVFVTNSWGFASSEVVSLTVVLPPVFETVTQTGDMILFTWGATAGLIYQVQYKTDLNQDHWNTLGSPVAATNSTGTASDTLRLDAQRFYRIVLLP